MADEILSLDQNSRAVSGAVTNDANLEIVQLRSDASTKRLLVDAVISSGAGAEVIVDDEAFTPAVSSVGMVGFFVDETATDSVNEGDGGAARMTPDRKQIMAGQFVDDAAWVASSYVNLVGIVYDDTSPDTLDEGDVGYVRGDANRNLRSSLGTLISGEDQTNNVLRTEQQFSYQAVVAADTQVKASSGFLHTVTISCNDAAPTAGSIIIYDNTAESGTQVFNHTFTTTPFVPFTVILDYIMGTGIYIGFTTTNDVNVSLSYR